MRKKFLIASAQEDYDFPLAEAARKQIFETAKLYRSRSIETEILILSPATTKSFCVDGINIRIIKKMELPKYIGYLRSFDELNYFGTLGAAALMISFFSLGKSKSITLTDGGIISPGRYSRFREFIKYIIFPFYDHFNIYTRYQAKLLTGVYSKYKRKLIYVKPVLSRTVARPCEKYRPFTILFLGHPSKYKGIDIVLRIIERLIPDIPQLKLIIADNGLKYDRDSKRTLDSAILKFPENITLKGKIDPMAELRSVHLLLHPIRQHNGTFAFPLSLYEALSCGTPFLSTHLEGLAEFFHKDFLCRVNDIDDFVKIIKDIYDNENKYREMAHSNLKELESYIFGETAMNDDVNVPEPISRAAEQCLTCDKGN